MILQDPTPLIISKGENQMDGKESNRENIKTEKMIFFSDQPITADKEQDVCFGHLDIADNLRKIIINCPIPFTIGLFGRWGRGKTTILNILRKKLQDNEEKIAVVYFDAWKYVKDSLRRTFLKQLENQLRNEKYIPKGYKIKEKSETGSQKEITNKLTWNWFNTICLIPLIAVLIISWQNPEAYKSAFTNGALFLAIIIILIDKIITREKIIISSERLQDPYEFEEEFKRITKEMSSKKLLVIIDNLDRCTHNKAVELLSTFKTFLAKDANVNENNQCIFLIACDDEAIKAHLKNVFTKNQNDRSDEDSFSADEFLRKFFNVSLRIPDFIDTELQTYTEELLKKTNISQLRTPDISYVITTAFRENPRQIKQFINILIANFFLAKDREESKNPLIIPKGVITKNVAFLAKFLIIQQKYHKEYIKIKEYYLDIDEIENIGEEDDYKAFLEATKTITVSEIRPFIYLKQSEEELMIPGVKELEICLIENKHEIVKEKINKLKVNPDHIKNLNKFILSLIKKNKIKNRIPSLFNIISSSLEALRHNNLELEQRYYDEISYLLSDGRYLRDELEKFQTSLIFNEILVRCNTRYRKEIIDQYLNILGQTKGDAKEPRISINEASIIFKQLQEHKKWLNQNQKENMKQKLNENYCSFPEVLSIFSEDEQHKKEFISEDTISKFVSTFSDAEVESEQNINEKVKLLLRFKEIIIPKIAQEVITSFQNLLNNENQKPYRKEKENLLKCIENIFDVLYDHILNITDKTVLNSFADIITQGINKLEKWDQRKIFIFICLKIVNMLEGSPHSNINTLIQSFFTNTDIDSIKFVFKKLSEKEQTELITQYLTVFNTKVLQQQSIFDFLYPLASKDVRIKWITSLINTSPQRASEKLKELNYKVDDKKKVVETLLQTAGRVAVGEKKNLYDAINQMKCANDAKLRNDFALQIKSLLKSTDKNQQEIGYIAFEGAKHFSHSLKREITREIVEWLRSLQPSDAGQTYTIKSVLISYDILELPVKKDYIDFVFDKLIKRGANIVNIQLGFEMFYKIKPEYEEYYTYFDDVFARLESEGNDQIKTEIKSGLLKLKPSKTNKKNRNFWAKL